MHQQVLLIIVWISWFCLMYMCILFLTTFSLPCFMPLATRGSLVALTVTLFIVYGGLAFIVSFIIYIAIVNYVTSVEKVRRNSAGDKRKTNPRLIKRITLIIFTIFFNWMCNSCVVIFNLFSYNSLTYVNTISIIWSLPVNAIMNPIVYTFINKS